jgi:uncharacterized membrane protein
MRIIILLLTIGHWTIPEKILLFSIIIIGVIKSWYEKKFKKEE